MFEKDKQKAGEKNVPFLLTAALLLPSWTILYPELLVA